MSTDLKLGLNLGYWQRGADDATELVQAAERLGYESVWTTEAYGSDAFTPLAWYGARTSRIKLGTSVVQISARTPAATAMTAMTLDHLTGGRLPLFVFPEKMERMYGPSLAGAGPDFDIAAMVMTLITDDVRPALDGVKMMLTLYIGGMGAKSRDFHADIIGRMGYAEAAEEIQALYPAGRRDEAFNAIPDELADGISLVGPVGRIRERLEPWRRSPVSNLLVMGPRDETSLRTIRDLVLG